MSRQKRSGTSPEMAVRRELHLRGLRYRVDAAPLSGLRRRADIVFGPTRVAVMIDGCFWHGCPEHATAPKANADWWREKLIRNNTRDRDTDRRLTDAGWRVLRFWEHQPAAEVADRIEREVRSRRT